jgi:hypothetical protein
MLLNSVAECPSNRDFQLILLGRIFSPLGDQLCKIRPDSFHAAIRSMLVLHLASSTFFQNKLRHLAFLTSHAAIVYSDWIDLIDRSSFAANTSEYWRIFALSFCHFLETDKLEHQL